MRERRSVDCEADERDPQPRATRKREYAVGTRHESRVRTAEERWKRARIWTGAEMRRRALQPVPRSLNSARPSVRFFAVIGRGGLGIDWASLTGPGNQRTG
ncbi:hypothetical protein GCM10009761_12410 [Agromyces terreus]